MLGARAVLAVFAGRRLQGVLHALVADRYAHADTRHPMRFWALRHVEQRGPPARTHARP